MTNNFETLAAALLSNDQRRWLNAEHAQAGSLADMWQPAPWCHDILCDNFWLGFHSNLGKSKRDGDWDYVEWLIARELTRNYIHRSFAKVGQWVDEFPLLTWQMAMIEERFLSLQITQAQVSTNNKRL